MTIKRRPKKDGERRTSSKARITPPEESPNAGRAIGSNLGKTINRRFSPAVFADERMRKADLACYVGDLGTILQVNVSLRDKISELDNGKYVFFRCVRDSLTKEDICDFFNRVCTDVPFRIEPDEMMEIGHARYAGYKSEYQHTFYGFSISKYESGGHFNVTDRRVDWDSLDDIPDAAEKLLKKSYSAKLADASAEAMSKQRVLEYAHGNEAVSAKLDDGKMYLVVFALSGKFDYSAVVFYANKLNRQLKSGLRNAGDDFQTSEVIPVGIVRREGSGDMRLYDIFALSLGRR